MGFRFEPLTIPEVVLVEPDSFSDDRGFFLESYRRSAFVGAGITAEFVQDNHSYSAPGTLRGLHYQLADRAQGKLIRVITGAIYDVAVDLRRSSPTYGRWVAATLSSDNHRMLYIPPGFAHGFCVVEGPAHALYKTTMEYASERERGILWSDPALGIPWPVGTPRLSPRDARLPLLSQADNDF